VVTSKSYHYHRLAIQNRFVLWGVPLFLAVLFYAVIFAPPEDPGQWPWLIGLIVSFSVGWVWSLWLQRFLRQRITLDSRGVSLTAPNRDCEIRWSDVGRFKDFGILGIIVIKSSDDSKTIRILSGISSYQELRATIRQRLAEHGRITPC